MEKRDRSWPHKARIWRKRGASCTITHGGADLLRSGARLAGLGQSGSVKSSRWWRRVSSNSEPDKADPGAVCLFLAAHPLECCPFCPTPAVEHP